MHRPERSRVEITDAADAEEYLQGVYAARLRLRHRQDGPREGPLLTHSRIAVGPFAIDEVVSDGHLAAAPDPLNRVVVVWTTRGWFDTDCDGLTGEASAGDIAVTSQPDLPHRATSQDLATTTVLLDPAVVAGVATGLPSSHAPLPVRFSSFAPVDFAAAQLWKNTVDYVRQNVLADDRLATPLVIGQAGRLLAAVTLSTFPNSAASQSSGHDYTDHKPVLLRRAMDFMEANATRDIGLADVAEAVHVTPRAVQYMFRRHLEITPLQYLRRLRLHYARQELLGADGTYDTVTEIAARWGFAHTGRFAVLYRQTYGESPHFTLRGTKRTRAGDDLRVAGGRSGRRER
ncbi:helix-turn-helix transcriptional regulator [Mycolicibacterium holsaticum]|uniref:AraC family transcriptional regulator n=1 Tax=Mycolicibacterium holsaticum TaxID=152142 RepID=A0A1E3S1E7_9MYCO|nr:helix-turn-helix transcriptional regulator [Mycolicibacterium holsaticum]ODQ95427.1 AraC family transcriptional regulator [Mycolicibacterium holsaticum]